MILVPTGRIKRVHLPIKHELSWFSLMDHKLRLAGDISNLHIPNIDAISGALFTLRIQYECIQTQCDEGASDDIDI